MVDCHTGVLGLNPSGPKRFSPCNYFTCGSSTWVAPELASGSSSGLYLVVVDARLSGNKGVGWLVVAKPQLAVVISRY